MDDMFFSRMPRPTLRGVLFNILMLASPLIGVWLGGPMGLFGGMLIACLGLSWFFFVHGRRGSYCEVCGRPLINLGRGTPLANSMNIGTFVSVKGMRCGYEGPGDECQRCGRIYCTNCAQVDMSCVCGSRSFRTVRLRYK